MRRRFSASTESGSTRRHLKAMIDAQIKEMENTEPFCLADTKVEMIDNTKRAQRDMEFAPQHSGRKNHMKGQAIVIFRAFFNQSICLWKRIKEVMSKLWLWNDAFKICNEAMQGHDKSLGFEQQC